MKFLSRLSTSALLLGATGYILFFSNVLFFALEVIVFTGLALYEFFTMLKGRGVHIYRLFGVVMGIIIPSIVYMELGTTQSGEILFLVLGCLSLFLLQFFHKDNSQALTGIAVTLFGVLYVSWFLSFVIKIRFMENGMLWVAYLVLVTKAADIGAYSVGSLFGRRTLIPHISPRKTVEGLLGGLFLSVFVSVILGGYLPIDFTLFHWVVTGFLIGSVGQIGDLSESLMKRFCNAKDSGNLLPGMGGVLDSIDSILFTAPIFYFHLKIYA